MPKRSLPRAKSRGFTLIEILVVVSIIAILTIVGFMSWKAQIDKANDARRKADLQRLQVAFEDFYNDHDCYPPADTLENCGGDDLKPYLDKIPCDPVYKTPYCYITDADSPTCFQKYRVLSTLKYLFDQMIKSLGCDSGEYCGWETECNADARMFGFNYGVSSRNVLVLNPNVVISPTPYPSILPGLPSPGPAGVYACTPQGDRCNTYGSDSSKCPISFSNSSVCEQYCVYPQYRCPF